MSSTSNRFYVTALEDGTTLHGNLVAYNKPLTQAWNGTTAIPDWTVAANQPIVYLTLLSGNELVQPATGFKWYYNYTEILFNESTGASTNFPGLFERTTQGVTFGSTTLQMPALRIIGNLASSTNVDIDTITFEGSYVINGSGVSFAAEARVLISKITAGAYLGIINFVGGISDITTPNQVLTLYGELFNPDGVKESGYTTKWYLNDDSNFTSGATLTVDGTQYTNAYQVGETDVVDHAMIKCEFYNSGSTLMYTSYAAADDMQDPEFMYIQYNGSNGNAASLRRGETATFEIWMGTRDNPAAISGYQYKVKLLDGDGDSITAPFAGVPDVDGNDSPYRPLSVVDGKATLAPTYNAVVQLGKKNLTGIVVATYVPSNS